jgi:hypothetical protein
LIRLGEALEPAAVLLELPFALRDRDYVPPPPSCTPLRID